MLRSIRLFVLFLLLSSTRAKEPFRLDQKGMPSMSPLDQEAMASNKSADGRIESNDTNIGIGEILAKDENLLTIAGVELPNCFKGCHDYFFKTIDVAVKSGNNYERFLSVCHRFVEARNCLDKLKHCGNYELFDVLTSGIKYMCIDQKDAFNATMECIDVNTSEIQDRCSKDCNVEGILAGWGVYAGLRQTSLYTPVVGNGPSTINVLFFRKITSEGCEVLQCFLSCLRSKYNTRCDGMAGSLLSEVIFRPIAMGQELMLLGPTLNLIRLILPMQCNFVMTKAGIKNFRIDSKLDAQLKNAYSSNPNLKPTEIRRVIGSAPSAAPEEVQNPWAKGAGDTQNKSPLEEDSLGHKYGTFDFR